MPGIVLGPGMQQEAKIKTPAFMELTFLQRERNKKQDKELENMEMLYKAGRMDGKMSKGIQISGRPAKPIEKEIVN